MASHGKIPMPDEATDLCYSFHVSGTEFDPINRIRSVMTELSISDSVGIPVHSEQSTMRYACLNQATLERLAEEADLIVVDVRTGFYEEAEGELVLVLQAS